MTRFIKSLLKIDETKIIVTCVLASLFFLDMGLSIIDAQALPVIPRAATELFAFITNQFVYLSLEITNALFQGLAFVYGLFSVDISNNVPIWLIVTLVGGITYLYFLAAVGTTAVRAIRKMRRHKSSRTHTA